MIDRKGIISFLLITFGITYLMEGILILSGFRVTLIPAVIGQYTMLIAMWVPALATFITTRYHYQRKNQHDIIKFRPFLEALPGHCLDHSSCFYHHLPAHLGFGPGKTRLAVNQLF